MKGLKNCYSVLDMFQVFFIGFTTGCFAGFVLEWMLKLKRTAGVTNHVETETMDDELIAPNDERTFKLVLVVNTELKMGDGKIVAQVRIK